MTTTLRTAMHAARWRVAGPWLLLLLLSTSLHLWALGERSFHHDESIHAKLSYDLAVSGSYRYDPTYHGPVLYYLSALTYHVLGDSDFTARLPAALAGIGMLWWAWRLRRPFGGHAAWWMGLLYTISPLFLYFGRFDRMDLLEAFFATGAFVAWLGAMRDEPRAWIRLGVWTGLAFATKENAYVTATLVVVSGALLAVDNGLVASLRTGASWLKERWTGFASSIAVFVLVTVPIYTVGFTRPDDWFFPVRAIAYWWSQHSIQRVGGPWWFHLPRLAQYEFLVLVAATVWVLRRWKRLRTIELFLFVYGVISILMYIYLGEKVPWLGVHQVWPFVPLAACQVARSLSPQGRWWSRSLVGVGLALTVLVSMVANFVLQEISPGDTRVESLHYVQTSPELVRVVREVEAIDREREEHVAAVVGEAVWPLTWYWRDLPVWWTMPRPGQRPPLVVSDLGKEMEVSAALGPGYQRERIPLRSWWLMYEGHPSPWEVLRYFLTRRPWGMIGSTDAVVLRRLSGAEATRREVPAPVCFDEAFAVTTAELLGEGWLGELRGVDLRDGRIVVADAGLSRVVIIEPDASITEVEVDGGMQQPEAVLWWSDEQLVVADTWNHRVVVVEPATGATRTLDPPAQGWYGPRALARSPGGMLAVSDTGHKRVVIYDASFDRVEAVADGSSGLGLDEPGGLAWLDDSRLLVCDTGNHRLVVVNRSTGDFQAIALPDAWHDYYSRPQLTVLDDGRWLVSDTPAHALWLVTGDEVEKLSLAGELRPTGVDYDRDSGRLVVGDLDGTVWVLEIGHEPS